MDSDNFTRQAEEIEALSSIYGDDWINEGDKTFSIKVYENKREVFLSITLTPKYPSEAPPKYEVSAPWMDRKVKTGLLKDLGELYLENKGETIVYQWAEKVREVLRRIKSPKTKGKPVVNEKSQDSSQLQIRCPEIIHGPATTDRKSTFQGHAAVIQSIEDVKAVLNELKKNKKIQNAKHNIYAFRIVRTTKRGKEVLESCDDDGEAHAGGRVLRLLQLLGQTSTLVVVTRWFGGIQLGPDRFRHINNVAQQAIERAGLLNTS